MPEMLAGLLPAEMAAALRAAADEAERRGRDRGAAARETAWGLRPAWPASLIAEAVEAALYGT